MLALVLWRLAGFSEDSMARETVEHSFQNVNVIQTV